MLRHLELRSLSHLAEQFRARMAASGAFPDGRAMGRMIDIVSDPADYLSSLVCACGSTLDIVSVVALAQQSVLPLSVRYDSMAWDPPQDGRDIRLDFRRAPQTAIPEEARLSRGIIADLQTMRLLIVDPDGQVATCSSGIRMRDIIASTAEYGLEPAAGDIAPAELCNLIVTGGTGSPVGSFLTSSASLAAAQVVLMDQRVADVSPSAHEDIFRSIRWGSFNAGIIASLRLRLGPQRNHLAAVVTFPLSQMQKVLSGYTKMVAAASPRLAIAAGVLQDPSGEPQFVLVPCWTGERGEGEAVIAAVCALGTPISKRIVRGPLASILELHDTHFGGERTFGKRRYRLPLITEDLVERVVVGATAGELHSSSLLDHLLGSYENGSAGQASDNSFFLEVTACRQRPPRDEGERETDCLFWTLAPLRPPLSDGYTQQEALRRKYDPGGILAGTV
ncbi:FAD-binding oxidoreductase [Rhizobium sp. BK251]|uniref:FAD-binding oxidoreductase n=1 Tax=Rhizobium sp. BK251 TaxID=2512125 RepID=UPI00104341FC|nr:FAD-binding oxidoreductase [Rhizobium sp. BK251]TCL74838.1 hypothetical protein EV286_102401 [Rhizobium sp. BK251]